MNISQVFLKTNEYIVFSMFQNSMIHEVDPPQLFMFHLIIRWSERKALTINPLNISSFRRSHFDEWILPRAKPRDITQT